MKKFAILRRSWKTHRSETSNATLNQYNCIPWQWSLQVFSNSYGSKITVSCCQVKSFCQDRIQDCSVECTSLDNGKGRAIGSKGHSQATLSVSIKQLISKFYPQILSTEVTFYIHTYIHPFNGPFSGTTRVSRYQKGKTNLDFTEARDSEWQWHQLGHMQVCTSLQTDNHASTPPLSFFTGRMPFLLPNQQRQSTEGTRSYLLHWYKCGS